MKEKKRVLLVMTPFYDYHERVKSALEANGYEVIPRFHQWFERNYHHAGLRDKIRIRLKHKFKKSAWIESLLKEEREAATLDCDILLVIANFPYSAKTLERLKEHNKTLKTYFFLWDALVAIPQEPVLLQKFDRVLTFNRPDVKYLRAKDPDHKSKYAYLPDFYIKNTEPVENPGNDLIYVSTINPDTYPRFSILKKLDDFCQTNNIKRRLSLRHYNFPKPVSLAGKIKEFLFSHKWWTYRRKIAKFKKTDTSGLLTDKTISLTDLQKHEADSKVIFDINHGLRQGFTLNVISALGNGKKLITTNPHIPEEPFYRPENIAVVTEENPVPPVEFFKTPGVSVDLECLEIINWVNLILDESYYDFQRPKFDIITD